MEIDSVKVTHVPNTELTFRRFLVSEYVTQEVNGKTARIRAPKGEQKEVSFFSDPRR